ncbi:MAG: riboflavin synthase [Chlamydiae bacterium]|nr:riboflavin synthase [Chlamydiota bacterium]MBI3277377.1 riboflavin synthase [Chlamydiota bacterium]
MFSGIIEKMGKFIQIDSSREKRRLEIGLEDNWKDLKISESVCVNGICLTAIEIKDSKISFDVLDETYQKTNLKFLQSGDFLNLERALRVGDRLGGHFVTGHIDGVGRIIDIIERSSEETFLMKFPEDLSPYIVPKGSIAVDGVSLTMGKVDKNVFEVHLIPYTLTHTNLGEKCKDNIVNLEVDILARYVLGVRKKTKFTNGRKLRIWKR